MFDSKKFLLHQLISIGKLLEERSEKRKNGPALCSFEPDKLQVRPRQAREKWKSP